MGVVLFLIRFLLGKVEVSLIALSQNMNLNLITIKNYSRWYRAPEILYGSQSYDERIDLWSMGCTFGEMILGKALFPGKSDIHQLCLVISCLGTPNEENWPVSDTL